MFQRVWGRTLGSNGILGKSSFTSGIHIYICICVYIYITVHGLHRDPNLGSAFWSYPSFLDNHPTPTADDITPEPMGIMAV